MSVPAHVEACWAYVRARGKNKIRAWWPCWCAIWKSIALDIALDRLWWTATGESFRGFDHGPVSPEDRTEARVGFETLPASSPWPWQTGASS